MNAISAVFVVVSLVVLGLGWWAINRKTPPQVRRRAEPPSRRPSAR